jgi:hypothetical protein
MTAIMATPPDHVWYAAYGSNLFSERLLTYLEGGRFGENTWNHPGARDPSPPSDDRAGFLPHQLVFAKRSPAWNKGGVAFLVPKRDPGQQTLGRLWRLTGEQFEDIVRQENRDPDLAIPWQGLDGDVTLGDGWYGHLLYVGTQDGEPVLSVTTAETGISGATVPPDESYLATIVAGLHETYHLGKQGTAKYLAGCPGIGGAWSKNKLMQLWHAVCGEPEEQ